jgi:hypothetical protein
VNNSGTRLEPRAIATLRRGLTTSTAAATIWLSMALLSASASASGELPTLVDITKAAGITWVHSIGDDELSNIVESTGAGCAFFDYDGDGDLDIYVVNGAYLKGISSVRGRTNAAKLTNALYRNNGDGTFTDVTVEAGVGDRGFGMACAAADYDNDGDRDLFVTNYGRDVLYRNNGDGTFDDVTDKAGVGSEQWSTGCTFFDFDRDGDLDLYVGGYLVFDPDYQHYFAAEAFPGPLAYKGQKDILYRNNGDGTFSNVAERAGVGTSQGRAMGVSSSDLDDDGDIDVYVANDGMENYLYRNNGDGHFSNVALDTGSAFGENGEATSAMGPEFGDFDNDGLVDILVPDMGYGCLYRNTGKGYYEEKSAKLGVARVLGQYTSWSGNFFDFDGDGELDILVVNGDSHHLEPEEDTLLHGQSGRFVDISAGIGADFQQKFVGRGSAVGDIDNDGDLDVLVLNLNARPRLLRNDGGNRANWLMIEAVGTHSNRDAIGTRVRVTAGGVTQTREVRSSSGYLSQSDHRLHYGLGAHATADRIEIRWPDGAVQVLEGTPANQVLTVTETDPK